jgi:hypothetical protein
MFYRHCRNQNKPNILLHFLQFLYRHPAGQRLEHLILLPGFCRADADIVVNDQTGKGPQNTADAQSTGFVLRGGPTLIGASALLSGGGPEGPVQA